MLKIVLIILFFVLLINKPTYVWRRVEAEQRTYAARVPLWLAVWGLLECEPETFFIVPRKAYEIFWNMAQEEQAENK